MDEIKETIIAMLSADNRYGCGFYSDEEWLEQYRKLADLVGATDGVTGWMIDGEVL